MINVITLCSGYDSQCMALERIKSEYDLDYNLVAWSEIDKYACQAHDAVFPQFKGRNLGDMTTIDWSQIKEDIDLLIYSTPCQSISNAGLQHGFAEGSGTRSSIIWSTLIAIDALRPKYLLLENVKAMVSKKFMPDFKLWCEALEERGYTNFWKVLNAKNYGIPQNRERVFLLSTRDQEEYEFPKPFELEKRLKDVLEKDVDESFYLSEKCVERLRRNMSKDDICVDINGVSKTLLANCYKVQTFDNYVYVVGNTNPSGHGMNGNVFDSNGLCPTLTTNKGEGPRILESAPTELSSKGKKYGNKRVQSLVDSGKISGHEVQFLDAYNQTVSDICGTIKTTIDSSCMSFISEPISCALRGRNPENPSDRKAGIELEQTLELGTDIANCITTVQKDSLVAEPKIFQSPRGFNKGALFDDCPAITSSRWQDNNFVTEPQVLTPKRTEYGKALRKDYDAGRIQESRHNMTELEPRTDGICNTITTVQKDNLLMEDFTNYRIRKLTPRECFRLMGVSEKDIDNIQKSGISKTQQYKMAGNSIVVDVLFHIFRKLFIDKEVSSQYKQLKLF